MSKFIVVNTETDSFETGVISLSDIPNCYCHSPYLIASDFYANKMTIFDFRFARFVLWLEDIFGSEKNYTIDKTNDQNAWLALHIVKFVQRMTSKGNVLAITIFTSRQDMYKMINDIVILTGKEHHTVFMDVRFNDQCFLAFTDVKEITVASMLGCKIVELSECVGRLGNSTGFLKN